MTVRLGEYKWKEAQHLIERKGIVIVPVGAFEQHGHHLPLDTDQRLVTAVSEGAIQKAVNKSVPVAMTSTVWTGFSPHHMNFPGSLTLTLSTFQSMIEELCQGLWQHGFRKILILNGHGGNAAIIKSVTQNLRFAHNVRTVNASYWDFAIDFMKDWRKSGPGGIDHACEMETSLMLHLAEHLVNKQEIREANWFPNSSYLTGDLTIGGVVSSAFDFAEITAEGVAGDPSVSTKEAGKELYEEITGRIATFLEEFYKWDWENIKEI